MNSLDETEILQRTLETLVDRFGFAEATISLLRNEGTLEVAAIAGTQDFGYQRGFQQKVGQGIIGHVAETREAYVTCDVSRDPYYFSSAQRNGSAIGVPMLDKENLLGVLYVESIEPDEFQSDGVETFQALASQIATSLQKARLYARTQEHLQVMTTLQSISHAVTSSLDLDEILNKVIQLLQDSFGYTYLSIYVLEENTLFLGAQIGYPDTQIIYEIPIDSGVIGRTARTKEIQFIRDISTDADFLPAAYEVKNEIAVPLLKDSNVLGVLNVESKGDVPLTENDVNVLNTLAGSVAVAIDNARLHAEVKLMAMTDVVSGLPNRRAFDETLYAEITRASRYSHPLSLIILDLDSFKEYNDKWGHPAGDIRLREIADLLRSNLRDPDMAARYGGEEFAIILPNTSKGGAMRLAERLRQSAESSAPQKSNDNFPIAGYTISIGVATYPDDATSMEELLLMADNAELTAKRLGKNQVYSANFANKIQRP
jgi:diguanylate cyclase (GGDEF)-like protein